MVDRRVFGNIPENLPVVLVDNQDFECVVVNSAGDWPMGTALTFEFDGGTTWAATSISGTDATFTRDKAVSDVIADRTAYQLRYVNGTVDRVLSQGRVERRAVR